MGARPAPQPSHPPLATYIPHTSPHTTPPCTTCYPTPAPPDPPTPQGPGATAIPAPTLTRTSTVGLTGIHAIEPIAIMYADTNSLGERLDLDSLPIEVVTDYCPTPDGPPAPPSDCLGTGGNCLAGHHVDIHQTPNAHAPPSARPRGSSLAVGLQPRCAAAPPMVWHPPRTRDANPPAALGGSRPAAWLDHARDGRQPPTCNPPPSDGIYHFAAETVTDGFQRSRRHRFRLRKRDRPGTPPEDEQWLPTLPESSSGQPSPPAAPPPAPPPEPRHPGWVNPFSYLPTPSQPKTPETAGAHPMGPQLSRRPAKPERKINPRPALDAPQAAQASATTTPVGSELKPSEPRVVQFMRLSEILWQDQHEHTQSSAPKVGPIVGGEHPQPTRYTGAPTPPPAHQPQPSTSPTLPQPPVTQPRPAPPATTPSQQSGLPPHRSTATPTPPDGPISRGELPQPTRCTRLPTAQPWGPRPQPQHSPSPPLPQPPANRPRLAPLATTPSQQSGRYPTSRFPAILPR